MSNTSATGGYLTPNPAPAPQPLFGVDLNRFIQAVLVGVSGLEGRLVRPRWQVEPANMPDLEVDWMAFGITRVTRDAYAYEDHVDDPDGGYDRFIRHETIELLLSFYGPDGNGYASLVGDGLQIAQNREALTAAGMAVVETGDLTTVPTLVKERWQQRVDMTLTLRRQVRRHYPILNFLSAAGTVDAETRADSFIATNP